MANVVLALRRALAGRYLARRGPPPLRDAWRAIAARTFSARPFSALWFAALLFTALLFTALNADCPSWGADKTAWPTGKGILPARQKEISLTWSDVPLRRALTNLCAVGPLGLVLDRRVDPDQLVEFSAQEITIQDAAATVARGRRLGVSLVGAVIYVGPTETSRRLRSVIQHRHDEANRLSAVRKTAHRVAAWSWPELSAPRDLVAQLAQEAGVAVDNLDDLPHDLWAAAELPPLSWVERMSLVLAQFHATFQWSQKGQRIEIVPIPEDVFVDKVVLVTDRLEETAAKYRELLPDATVTVRDKKIHLRGFVEDLERVQSATEGQKTRTRVTGKPVTKYSLVFKEQPLRPLLVEVAKKSNRELKFDEAAIKEAGRSLDERVTFTVKNVSLEELLTAALRPAGLDFRLSDDQIEIRPLGP